MLFKEEQLNSAVYINGLSGKLQEQEIIMSPRYIPIKENSRLNGYVIRFDHLYDYADKNGYTLDEAVNRIAGANGIRNEELIVSIKEYDFNTNPLVEATIFNSNFYAAVTPYNYEKDKVFQLFEEAIDICISENDDNLFDAVLEGLMYPFNEEPLQLPAPTVNNTGSSPSVVTINQNNNSSNSLFSKLKNKGRALANDMVSATKNKLIQSVGDKVKSGVEYLSTNDNVKKVMNDVKNNVSDFVSDTMKDSVNKVVKNVTGLDNGTELIKNMGKGGATAAGALALIGMTSAGLNSMMDERKLQNGNPSVLNNMKNAAMGLINRITGRKNSGNVPPQQQGILDNILQKIKDFIARINAKLGGQG